jgi:hypothetical protein
MMESGALHIYYSLWTLTQEVRLHASKRSFFFKLIVTAPRKLLGEHTVNVPVCLSIRQAHIS